MAALKRLTGAPEYVYPLEDGWRSLRKISALDFDVAAVGHGKAITTGASQKFRSKWGT